MKTTLERHRTAAKIAGFLQGARWGLVQVDPLMGGTVVTWGRSSDPQPSSKAAAG